MAHILASRGDSTLQSSLEEQSIRPILGRRHVLQSSLKEGGARADPPTRRPLQLRLRPGEPVKLLRSSPGERVDLYVDEGGLVVQEQAARHGRPYIFQRRTVDTAPAQGRHHPLGET